MTVTRVPLQDGHELIIAIVANWETLETPRWDPALYVNGTSSAARAPEAHGRTRVFEWRRADQRFVYSHTLPALAPALPAFTGACVVV